MLLFDINLLLFSFSSRPSSRSSYNDKDREYYIKDPYYNSMYR